ncbi:MAG: hypothetical protein ACE5OZ_26095 [Candidatus Heimdallarchaeota archaeon]
MNSHPLREEDLLRETAIAIQERFRHHEPDGSLREDFLAFHKLDHSLRTAR